MWFAEIIIIALALAADAFTVGIAVGAANRTARQRFRLSFHFGLFQAVMPTLGALAGSALERWIAPFDHWLVFGLLLVIGGRMALAALRDGGEERTGDPTRGLTLVGLSLAVSIDALGVGFTLGLSQVPIPFAVIVIGIVAGALTLAGMLLAGRIPRRFGRATGVGAGLVLVGLGVKTLFEHL